MMSQNEVSEMLQALRKEYLPFEVEILRDQLAAFLHQYRQLGQSERVAIHGQFGPEHGAEMLRCAQELAVRGVRSNSADDVELGLLAVALERVQSDFRNMVVSLCLLHHSAKKLGVDPVPLFHNAAAYGNNKARDFMLQYLQKGDKNIRAIAMEESYGPNGFDYVVIAI
jgi:hypothetical protein